MYIRNTDPIVNLTLAQKKSIREIFKVCSERFSLGVSSRFNPLLTEQDWDFLIASFPPSR